MSYLAIPSHDHVVRVLMVGSREELLEATSSFLQRQPTLRVVGTVQSTAEVRFSLPDLRPDVILIDLDDVGPRALEEVGRLRASLPGTGIIALALSKGSAFRRVALDAGADALVDKGRLVRDLPPAIGHVARESRARLASSVPAGGPEKERWLAG